MLNRKGQNTAEYAILIAIIIAAAVGMQTYVKRNLQGRVREAVDHTGTAQMVGDANLTFSGGQYEPYYAQSDTQVRSENKADEEIGARGQIIRTNMENVTKVDQGGTETVLGAENAD